MEPYGTASHVVLVDEDTVWPSDDAVDKVHVAEWLDETQVVLPACNSGFHEYGVADIMQAAAVACECALSLLDTDGKLPSRVWSVVRSTGYCESLDVSVVPGPLVPKSSDVFNSIRLTRNLEEAFVAQEGGCVIRSAIPGAEWELVLEDDVLAMFDAISMKGLASPQNEQLNPVVQGQIVDQPRTVILKTSSRAMANCFDIEKSLKRHRADWYIDSRITEGVVLKDFFQQEDVVLLPSGEPRRIDMYHGSLFD
ncbi:hypothetical protein [Paraburkholderia guartelaensis]|uniref:hypothetical protein n=1 Tax=Paraburkholderia guartelaensis TaxID=2546446 RepID=UPI002AB657CF|nr:hypothetical protein [Paraburkholderia guartelaensis]